MKRRRSSRTLRMLPTVATLSLAGAALGVPLGQSAIDAIDPFYFTMPQGTDSYAALVPAASRTGAMAGFARASADEPRVITACLSCPPFSDYEPGWDASASRYDVDIWTPNDEEPDPSVSTELYDTYEPASAIAAELESEVERVTRYAHYPIRAEAVEAHRAGLTGGLEDEPVMPPSEADTAAAGETFSY